MQGSFDLETTKIKLHSVRALKSYLNEKTLIHGRETAPSENLVHRVFKRTLKQDENIPKIN